MAVKQEPLKHNREVFFSTTQLKVYTGQNIQNEVVPLETVVSDRNKTFIYNKNICTKTSKKEKGSRKIKGQHKMLFIFSIQSQITQLWQHFSLKFT